MALMHVCAGGRSSHPRGAINKRLLSEVLNVCLKSVLTNSATERTWCITAFTAGRVNFVSQLHKRPGRGSMWVSQEVT
jgi:hypothetical protein